MAYNPKNIRPRFPVAAPISGQSGQLTPNAVTFIHSLSDLIAFGPVIEDTHANRENTNRNLTPFYGQGEFGRYLFYETDTGLVYLSIFNSSAGAWQWQYLTGTFSVLQANLSTFASSLGTADTGTLVYVSDYGHILQWTGSAWQRGPGDNEHSDSFHFFASAPTDPGWHICDGSTQNYLQYTGTLGSRTLPSAGAYPKAGNSYAPTPVTPTVPTISGVTGNSTIGITIQNDSDGGVAAGTGSSLAALNPHTHPYTDPGHHHTLTAANSPIALPGDPIANFQLILYYRQ